MWKTKLKEEEEEEKKKKEKEKEQKKKRKRNRKLKPNVNSLLELLCRFNSAAEYKVNIYKFYFIFQ